MKLVYTHPSAIAVAQARNAVELADIKCVLRNEYASGAMGELAPIDAWPEIWVLRDRDYDRAKLVIEQLHADLQEADWECGHCGRFSPASFDWCWHCAGERHAVIS